MKHLRLLPFVMIGLSAVLLSGCPSDDTKELTITMINESDYPVHLWVTDWEAMGSSNKVEPGKNRSWRDADDIDADEYIVAAGRNEQTLTSVICVNDADDEEDPLQFVVRFTESPFSSLTCEVR